MIVSVFLNSACKEDSNPITSFQSGPPSSSDWSEWVQSFYEPNLVGVITCESRCYDGYLHNNWNPGHVLIQTEGAGYDNYARAAFRDASPSHNPFNVSDLLVNACLMRPYAVGAYAKDDPNKLDLYFGGGVNKFFIEDLYTSILPDTTFEEVSFNNRVKVTNFHRYDTIHKAQGFTVNWTGGGSKVEICLDLNNFRDDYDSTYSFCIGSGLIDNTGSFTFPPEWFASGLPGLPSNGVGPTGKYFNIQITSYDPVKRTLSNGKKIIFVGWTQDLVTVTLAD